MALGRIRIVRMQQGLKLYELAARLGMSESKLSRIETGRILPTKEQLDALSRILGISAKTFTENSSNEMLKYFDSIEGGNNHDE